MTFRITQVEGPDGTLLQVDGWLDADGLAALERACAGAAGALTLDLTGLKQADESALGFLRGLQAAGVKLAGLSPYLAMRMAPRRDLGASGRQGP